MQADVNERGIKGEIPLIVASQKGYEAIVTLLLVSGANMNMGDEHGQTAFYWASNNGHDAIVKLLLESGVDLNAKNVSEGTALLAASFGVTRPL